MKKTFQIIVSFVLIYAVYLSSFNTYARASVINSVVPVSIVKQAKSNWCWAACAEMFGRSIYSSSSRTQNDIVKYVKGSEVNETANVSECLTACQYGSYNKKPLSVALKLDFYEIGTRIAKDELIYSILIKEGTNQGHVVVIAATQFIDGNNGIENNIDYIDPLYGKRTHCSLEEFYNGHYHSCKVLCMIYTR